MHSQVGLANVYAAHGRGARSVAVEPRLVSARLVACCGSLGGIITRSSGLCQTPGICRPLRRAKTPELRERSR